MLLPRLCLTLLVLSVALGQRVHVAFAGGLVDPFVVAFVAAAAVLWVRDGFGRGDKPYRAMGINTVGPLLFLLFLLPPLSIIVGYGDTRHLYGLMLPATILAVLSLARARRRHGLSLESAGYALILIHGVYGLLQTLYRLGIVPASLWAPAAAWDARSQVFLNEAYLITNRSTGLFINANSFGLWSCFAVVFAATLLNGRRQTVGLVLGVAGVIGSQSRTAVAILAVLLVVVVRALGNRRVAGKVFVGAVAVGTFAAFGSLFGWLPKLIEGQFLWRLQTAVGVVSEGASSDANLGARFEAWRAAWEFSGDYPLGTLRPPDGVFGSFIDNEFVALFLQGGVLMVAAFVIALLSPAVLTRRGVPGASRLWLFSLVVAISSWTMTPLEGFPSMALAWLAAAATVGKVPEVAAGDEETSAPTGVQSRARPRLRS